MRKWLSWLISRLFDPILIIPLLLLMAIFIALVNGDRWRFFILLLLVDVALPGIVLAYFIQKGKVLSGWDVRKREERVPLFIFVVVAHLVGVLAAWSLNKHPMAEFLMGFWLLTVVFAVITNWWKISIHAGVMSAMVTFMVLEYSRDFAWMYALLLLVIWARVYGKYHRLSQAIVGGVIPAVVLPVYFWWVGLI